MCKHPVRMPKEFAGKENIEVVLKFKMPGLDDVVAVKKLSEIKAAKVPVKSSKSKKKK